MNCDVGHLKAKCCHSLIPTISKMHPLKNRMSTVLNKNEHIHEFNPKLSMASFSPSGTEMCHVMVLNFARFVQTAYKCMSLGAFCLSNKC